MESPVADILQILRISYSVVVMLTSSPSGSLKMLHEDALTTVGCFGLAAILLPLPPIAGIISVQHHPQLICTMFRGYLGIVSLLHVGSVWTKTEACFLLEAALHSLGAVGVCLQHALCTAGF